MKKVAVITGASSGIGLAAASLFAAEGYTVYNISRRPSPSENNIAADISDETAVKAAFEQIGREQREINVLVNCAGFGISGATELTDTKDARRLLDVNFFGTFMCCKYAAPLMRSSKGRIINVSSAAAIFSIPFQAFYSASKAAVNSLTLALANELSLFGISVCAVMPGDVKTGFTAARRKDSEGELYKGIVERSVAVMEHDEENGMSAEYIAKYIYKLAVKRKVKPLYTAGFQYKVFAFLAKVLPTSILNLLVGSLYIKRQ